MVELTEKEKAWIEVKKSQARFYIGMGAGFIIAILTIGYASFYGEQSIPHFLRVWLPMIITGIFAASWLQAMFAGNKFVAQCN